MKKSLLVIFFLIIGALFFKANNAYALGTISSEPVTNLTDTSVTLNGDVSGWTAITGRGFYLSPKGQLYGQPVSNITTSVQEPFHFTVNDLICDTDYKFTAFVLTPDALPRWFTGSDVFFKTSVCIATPSGTPTPTPIPTPSIPSNLSGWAWSSNIGWFKLDPIALNAVTGDLTGWSWSPNIGWIKFGCPSGSCLSDFPTGSGNAKINLATGVVSGWARACAGTVSGDCSSMTSRTDGWDGWIELAGTNHNSQADPLKTGNYGLFLDILTGKLTGKAWGGEVVGWVDFNSDTPVSSVSFTGSCSNSVLNGSVTFTAKPSGGTNQYEYDWSDSHGWVTDSSKSVTYSNPMTITQPLTIRDVNTGVTVAPICSVTVTSPSPTPSFGGITASNACTISADPVSLTPLYSDGKGNYSVILDPKNNNAFVVFTINPALIVGGVGPLSAYTYSFETGNGFYPDTGPSTATTWRNKYVSPRLGGMTRVKIYDNSSPKKVSGYANCGNMTVIGDALTLKIGATGASASIGSERAYMIRVGSGFGLKWTNAYSGMIDPVTKKKIYQCSAVISNGGSGYWDKNQSLSNKVDIETVSQNMNVDLSSASADLGPYDFKVRCKNITNSSEFYESNSVKLIVTDVSQTEI